MRKFNREEVIKAIENSSGFISSIAVTLKCDWHTAKKFIEKYQLEYMLTDKTEAVTDEVEGCLLKKIREGDTTAMIFYLKTKGRNRGYSEKIEIADQRPIIQIMDLHTQ